MTPEGGQRLGPYELLNELGAGGMGLVYRAWDGRLHREVAVKLLHSDFQMPGARERFLREARAASALNHPNICTIFDIGEQDNEPYLVMELLQGETLKSRIAHGAIPIEELLRYAQEIAGALGAAHARGIIHRDVKPANIFLVDLPNGIRQAKVLDFGLAKFDRGNSPHTMDLTSTGATVGTVAYMSPEQARGEVLDARSDLFSLGVVLYEMATLQVPFQGTTSAMVFVQLLSQHPEPVRDWNDAIPKELEKIIHRLLSKDRASRFQNATELQEALSRITQKSGMAWMRKPLAAPAIPLVRAADPVARAKRPLKRPSGAYAPIHYEASRQPFAAPDTDRRRPDPHSGVVDAKRRASDYVPEDLIEAAAAQIPKPAVAVEPPLPIPQAAPASRPSSASLPAQPAAPTPVAPPIQRAPSGQVESIAASAVRDPAPARRPSSGSQPSVARSSVTQFSYVEQPEEDTYDESAEDPDQPIPAGRLRRQRTRRIRLAIFAALVVAAAAGGYWWQTHKAPTPVLADGETLLIGTVQNKTGDETLNGAINEGLAIQLRQSHLLSIRSIVAYESGLRLLGITTPETSDPSLPQKIAQRVGAKAYMTGEISGTGPYTLSLALLNSDTNQKIAAVDDTAGSREQLADLITRAADAIRSDMGEAGDAIAKSDVPLRRDGTADIDALHALALAEAATPGGHWLDALAYYQKAAALEPKFAQAQIGLAWAYRREHAEAAAADAARAAQGDAQESSERTRMLAQYTYEINASGDYTRALAVIRDFNKQYPQDPEGLEDLARVLRLEGHLPEALQAAQSAVEKDPYRLDAYTQAETTLLDMDRYDAALQMVASAQHSGLVHPGSHLLAAYLVGQSDAQIQQFWTSQPTSIPIEQGAAYATYLDNTGQMTSGRAIWQSTAARAVIATGLQSSGAFLLAQGALNRALAQDCAPALDMARQSAAQPQGITALFNAGMAQALCGDTADAQHAIATLTQTYPQSTAATGYYLPDLKAAIALHANDPVAALDALKSARSSDLISLTPYLRGLAHISTRDTKLGLVDFQMVLAHRGSSVAALNDAYPMAQLGLARAFSQSGDTGNGSTAYKTVLDLWKQADPREPALAEAHAKAR